MYQIQENLDQYEDVIILVLESAISIQNYESNQQIQHEVDFDKLIHDNLPDLYDSNLKESEEEL